MGYQWIITNIVAISLATLAVGLRLWARKLRRRLWALNDYAIILGLVQELTQYSNQKHVADCDT